MKNINCTKYGWQSSLTVKTLGANIGNVLAPVTLFKAPTLKLKLTLEPFWENVHNANSVTGEIKF